MPSRLIMANNNNAIVDMNPYISIIKMIVIMIVVVRNKLFVINCCSKCRLSIVMQQTSDLKSHRKLVGESRRRLPRYLHTPRQSLNPISSAAPRHPFHCIEHHRIRTVAFFVLARRHASVSNAGEYKTMKTAPPMSDR